MIDGLRFEGLRIIFIFKRYYTGKDVIRDRFGRLYELPTQLARLGHEVTVLCLDYRNSDHQKDFTEVIGVGLVHWITASVRTIFEFKFGQIYQNIKNSDPSVVIGSSDIPSLWLSHILAKHLKIPYVVDLYDNYESFGQARIPGFKWMLRTCVSDADASIAVSTTLASKVQDEYKPTGPLIVMNNGSVRSRFYPGDCEASRVNLGLPKKVKLIGTAGNLSKLKGLDTIYEAWARIEKLTEDVYLVLAGPVEASLPVPEGDRVIYLGELPEVQVGELFRALDVGIIPAHDSEFGRYCFPQKLYEMVACDLPVVAAKVGAIAHALKEYPEMLFTPGDAKSLVEGVTVQLEKLHVVDIKPVEWGELVESIEPLILQLAK